MNQLSTLGRVVLIGTLVVLAGCVRSPLKSDIDLACVDRHALQYTTKQADLTVRVKALSKQGAKKLLGKSMRKYGVLQISITNHGTKTWELDKNDIDLPLVPNDIVLLSLKGHRGLPAFAARLAGIFGTCFGFIYLPCRVPNAKGLLGGMAVGSAAYAASSVAEEEINRSYGDSLAEAHDTLDYLSPDVLVIEPNKTQSMLLFARNKRVHGFDFSLHSIEQPYETQIFDISF